MTPAEEAVPAEVGRLLLSPEWPAYQAMSEGRLLYKIWQTGLQWEWSPRIVNIQFQEHGAIIVMLDLETHQLDSVFIPIMALKEYMTVNVMPWFCENK